MPFVQLLGHGARGAGRATCSVCSALNPETACSGRAWDPRDSCQGGLRARKPSEASPQKRPQALGCLERDQSSPGPWLGKLRLGEGNWLCCALAFLQGSGLGGAPSTECRPGCEQVIPRCQHPPRPWAWHRPCAGARIPISAAFWQLPKITERILEEAREGLFLLHVTTSSAV